MLQTLSPERDAGRAGRAPAVSVIVPAHNAAPYIAPALDSVFAQTFTDYEVIVVNDGSPDTPELERALEPYRDRILYLKQENQGPSAARNAGVDKARAAYVAFLDSDDLWLPDYLAAQMAALAENPSLDLIYADALLFGESVPPGLTFMQAAPSRGPVTFESLLRFECCIITSCVVARRSALVDAGLFDPKFLRSEDYDLWLRLAHRGGQIAYQRKVIARHRAHGASLAADSILMFESLIEVYQKIANTLSVSPPVLRVIEKEIRRCQADVAFKQGSRLFMARQFDQAAEALGRAYEYYRSRKLRIMLMGLRVAPHLLWHGYNIRRGLLRKRQPTRGLT